MSVLSFFAFFLKQRFRLYPQFVVVVFMTYDLQFNCLIVFVQLSSSTLGAGLVDTKDTEWYAGTREQKTTTDKVHASSNMDKATVSIQD